MDRGWEHAPSSPRGVAKTSHRRWRGGCDAGLGAVAGNSRSALALRGGHSLQRNARILANLASPGLTPRSR